MEISEIVHQFKKITKQVKFNYNNEVEVIIKCRIKDKYRIEALLDLILDFCFDRDILLVYKKLRLNHKSVLSMDSGKVRRGSLPQVKPSTN